MPVTNVVLRHVSITASKTFDIYNAAGVEFVDSQITVPAGQKNVTLYNGQLAVSNDAPAGAVILLDGTNSANALALYNAAAATTDSNALGANPITLGAGTLTVSNNLWLSNASTLNFLLGTNSGQIAVTGSLALAGALNVADGGGFNAGQFALFSSGGAVSGSLALASLPTGYSGSIVTNAPGRVVLMVEAPVAPQPVFGSVASGEGGLAVSGSGGPLNETYSVLASASVALPLAQWTAIATNAFDASGRFSFSISTNAGAGGYYVLRVP
jgi:hypothetical protein